jgi:alpha-glucosidase
MPENYLWWQKGIIYQIYPRSFQDTDHDGTGDLRGIMNRLDYLQWLGVDAIWLSPIFSSPMKDFGYDIMDYNGIDPVFGNMHAFDQLLELTHQKGMKLILDLVPNHSSDQHPWFLESRSSRDNPKRDWYIWRDARNDGSPPTNWQSVFGGSGWEWDEKTGQYYYHAFLKEQPDLNWRNPEVQQAMLDVMRFWLDKGVDGFRVDVIWHMIKDDKFRDNPPNPQYQEGEPDNHRYLNTYSEDQPLVHEIIAEMRKVIDSYDERLLIGEIYLPLDKLVTYYGKDGAGVHLPFNFQLIQIEWNVVNLYALINEYEGRLLPENWPNWVLGNHDKARVLSRVGEQQAKLAAVLLMTLRGTPIMYYGDEIGMRDVPIPPDRMQDLKERTMPGGNRDPQRTPMQWDKSDYAGFSTVEPWLPLDENYQQINVQKERENTDSYLSLYRRLIKLRQDEPALQVGAFIDTGLEGELMLYKREHQGDEILVALNFGKQEAVYEAEEDKKGKILFATEREREGETFEGKIELKGEEAVVVKL